MKGTLGKTAYQRKQIMHGNTVPSLNKSTGEVLESKTKNEKKTKRDAQSPLVLLAWGGFSGKKTAIEGAEPLTP